MSFGPDAVRLGNWRERAKIALVPGLLIAAVAVWVMIWLLHGYRFYFQDDAFISLRYVWNLLEHGELTWNLGEALTNHQAPPVTTSLCNRMLIPFLMLLPGSRTTPAPAHSSR